MKAFQGLQINLEKLNRVTIASDEQSVVVQGGLDNGHALQPLWEKGYVASKGSLNFFPQDQAHGSS